jgi:hypothetical protein
VKSAPLVTPSIAQGKLKAVVKKTICFSSVFFYNHLYQPSVFRNLFLKSGINNPFGVQNRQFNKMAVFNPSTICKTYPRGIRTAVTSEFHRAGRTGMEAAENLGTSIKIQLSNVRRGKVKG